MSSNAKLPDPIIVPVAAHDLETLLDKEWLLSNHLGSYASGTVVGCNTRRYHGLLIAATLPPVGRLSALSTVMEQWTVGGTAYELATNEFAGSFSPMGVRVLAEFRNDVAPTFIYRVDGAELVKEILLAREANAVAIRYTVRGAASQLRLWPFSALRDYHYLRKVHEPHQMNSSPCPDGVMIEDRQRGQHKVFVLSPGAAFEPHPQWWYRFAYRGEMARGQDSFEDLYTPGCFAAELQDGKSLQVTASLDEPLGVDFAVEHAARRARLEEIVSAVGPGADEPTRRLAASSDAFIARRDFPNLPSSTTILAGYHWFADWGRDSFIALPGLLLCTGRLDLAREVFSTFAGHISRGMVPNRFDDYSATAHYNSMDASLWFILAADRYMEQTGDQVFWAKTLMPACNTILAAYREGTEFDIHADSDGLLTGGNRNTQLTWMDVALGEEAVTPRHGKAVEVNALWHKAHCVMARRCTAADATLAARYRQLAEGIVPAFARAFWNEQGGYLYDCVTAGVADASIRPNQIFAVSLAEGLLSPAQRASVVRMVTDHLLTPYGLRTLSRVDTRYRRRYGGSWESRDRAYHQGTVWAWLIGPFIEAYLRVEGESPAAISQSRQWLTALEAHLNEAALGFVSEIFDGDPPHTPRGCVAQAWSVGELLRVKMLLAAKERQQR